MAGQCVKERWGASPLASANGFIACIGPNRAIFNQKFANYLAFFMQYLDDRPGMQVWRRGRCRTRATDWGWNP